MAFWSTDLTTEDGIASATGLGSIACFVWAGLLLLGATLSGALQLQSDPLLYAFCFAVLEALVCLIAGWRLRTGKGLIWGSAAAALLALELVTKLLTMAISWGIILIAVLLVVVINGVRGAWAMRQGIPDAEADAEIFS